MVKVKEDLTGKKFGKFTVIKQVDDYVDPSGIHHAQWLCQCECGSDPIIERGSDIKNGNVRSCGCSRKKQNIYDLSGEYGVGWATNTNQKFYFDLEDYDKIKDYCWNEVINHHGYRYMATNDPVTKRTIRMHYLICGKYYDHKNRNALDNRKENLRPATTTENARNHNKQRNNTSGFIGVTWDAYHKKWAVHIHIDKKRKKIGRFSNKDDAVIARLQAEAKYYGEFAPQRHLFEEYGIVYKE